MGIINKAEDPLTWAMQDLLRFNRPQWDRGKTLSGSYWVGQFPNSVRLEDLNPLFRPKVESFLAALKKADAAVSIAATLRPAQRAYLMHYSYKVAKGALAPTHVPPMAAVDIEWVHKTAKGAIDVLASKNAASEMVRGYGIVFGPALTSRHTEGNAIDMTISWESDLTIVQADGTPTTIKTQPRNGGNAELNDVGAGYGVVKLVSDPPHWSSDGH